ncbi:hypothetical protein ACHAWO_004948 [Cyclotella atomus]|uniref:Uncharacterized protein n=1 Tax=Cyclotella atomus TaxID=382360 RepID=A0ABD3NBE3_9STRA
MGIEPKFVAEAMCEGMYLPEEIIALEIDILRTLGWRLNGPTASDFIKHFIELLPTGFDEEVASSLHDLACEKVKMGLLDYRLSLELPSHLALASISSLFQDINDEEQEKLGLSSWISRISCLMATSGLGGFIIWRPVTMKNEDA